MGFHIVLDPYCPGTILSWIHIVVDPYCPGSISSWIHLVLDPSCPGSILSWILIVLDPYCPCPTYTFKIYTVYIQHTYMSKNIVSVKTCAYIWPLDISIDAKLINFQNDLLVIKCQTPLNNKF